ncbi:MAG: hypothetical protein BGP07_16805 [Rhizobiales bacterium 63-22]|nr:MAG: hypothetical protein BGP07_16805 [Rhizobiales bacterium 63-22]
MTAEQFCQWLGTMKEAGRAATDVECGATIGKTKISVLNYKARGTDKTVALACQAALHGLPPYGESDDA